MTEEPDEFVLWARSFDEPTPVELDRVSALPDPHVWLLPDSDLILWGVITGFDGPRATRVVTYDGSQASPVSLTSWSQWVPILAHVEGGRSLVFFSAPLPGDQYPDFPYSETPWMIQADLGSSTTTPLFPTQVEALQPAIQEQGLAWIRGRDLGGSFLATFNPQQPTGLTVVATDLGTMASLVTSAGVFVVGDKDAPKLYRLEGMNLVLVADLDDDAIGGPAWAGDALWLRTRLQRELLRTTLDGAQTRVALPSFPYEEASILSAGDRLALLLTSPSGEPGQYQFLEQLLPDPSD